MPGICPQSQLICNHYPVPMVKTAAQPRHFCVYAKKNKKTKKKKKTTFEVQSQMHIDIDTLHFVHKYEIVVCKYVYIHTIHPYVYLYIYTLHVLFYTSINIYIDGNI